MTIEDIALTLDIKEIEKAQSNSDFADNAWLTFYLSGHPVDLDEMNIGLEKLGAKNLDGSEGGYIYAKVPVQMIEQEIIEQVDQVQKLAEKHNVSIEIVDLDPTHEVHDMKFYTLWQNN